MERDGNHDEGIHTGADEPMNLAALVALFSGLDIERDEVRGRLLDVTATSYVRWYIRHMAVVNFRTDERSDQALSELTSDGATVSEAVRQALVDAVRLRRREQMRRESLELASDPVDLAESRQVLQEMDELRAW